MHYPSKCALIAILFWRCLRETLARGQAHVEVRKNIGRNVAVESAHQSHVKPISSGEALDVAVEKLMQLLLAMPSAGRGQWRKSIALQAPRQYKHRRILPVQMNSPPVAELVQFMPSLPPIQHGKLATLALEETDGYDPLAVNPGKYKNGEMLTNGQLGLVFKIELTRERLLVGTDAGSIMIFDEEVPPKTIVEGFIPGSLRGCCIGEKEDILYVIGSGSLYTCKLVNDECTTVEEVGNIGSSLSPGTTISSVTRDTSGNLYLGTTEGLVILNESNGAFMRAQTSETVTGVRFDKINKKCLYLRVGDTLWQFDTDAFGDMPNLGDEIYKDVECVQIHIGW